MENEQLVTIIVPVFNDPEGIKRCLHSLIDQSYSNIEILVINDGSTDNTLKVCESISKGDGRIRIISQKNKGLSYVRNLGVKEAKGAYLAFVDSDDYVGKHFIFNLMHIIVEENVLMGCCQYKKTLKTDLIQEKRIGHSDYSVFNDRQILVNALYHDRAEVSVWDKIYHISLFENLLFPVSEIYEDIAVMPELFKRAERIAVHNKEDYFNYLKPNSIQRSGFSEKKMILIDRIDAIIEEARKNKDQEILDAAIYRKGDILLELLSQIDKKRDKENYLLLWSDFKGIRENLLKNYHYNANKVRYAAYVSYLGERILSFTYRIFVKFRASVK